MVERIAPYGLKSGPVHLIEPKSLSQFLAAKSWQQCQAMLILSACRFVSPIKPGIAYSSSAIPGT